MTRIPLLLLASAVLLCAAPTVALAGGGGGGGGKYQRPAPRVHRRPARPTPKYRPSTKARPSGKTSSSYGSKALSYGVKRQLADSRRPRLQYKDPIQRRGFTGVAEAKALTSALQSNGLRKVDVKAVKNFLDKAFVEPTNGARKTSQYLEKNARSYVVSAAGARTLNSFFAKQNLPVRAAPKSWMSNAALSR